MLTVRHSRDDDLDFLRDLYQACWGSEKRNCFERTRHWLHRMNPGKRKEWPELLVLESAGYPVGASTCIYAKLMVQGQVHDHFWVSDIMVHPDHRGTATGYVLAKKVVEMSDSFLSSGFPVIRSVPLWRRVCRQTGLQEVGGFGPLVLPLSSTYFLQHRAQGRWISTLADLVVRPALSLYRRIKSVGAPPSRRCRIQEIERFDGRITNFFQRVGPGYPILVVRDAPYLNWRYADSPDREYRKLIAEDPDGELLGYMIAGNNVRRNGLHEGWIIDCLVARGDEATYRALAGKTIDYLRQKGCHVVKAMECHLEDIQTIMRRLGFLEHPRKTHYLIFHNGLHSSLEKEFFTDRTNWYITRNFSDEEFSDLGMVDTAG